MAVLDSGKVVQTWVKVFGQFFCWCCWTDLNFRVARCLLVGQSTLPTTLALLASKGLLGLGIAFQGSFLLGWQVPLASRVVSAPSSGTSRSSQVRSVAPSVDGQSGPCAPSLGCSCVGRHSDVPTTPFWCGNVACPCSIGGPRSSISSSCSRAVVPSCGGMSWPFPALPSVGVHCGSTSGAPSAVSPWCSGALSTHLCSVG